MPMASARSRPRVTSSSVAGKRWARSAVTGLVVCQEVPRSPWTAVPQIDQELHEDRAVEAHLGAQLREAVRRGDGAEHQHGRIARDDLHQQEAHEHDAQELREDEEQAPADVGKQSGSCTRRRGRPPDAVPARRRRRARIGEHLDARADQREAEHGDGERQARERSRATTGR